MVSSIRLSCEARQLELFDKVEELLARSNGDGGEGGGAKSDGGGAAGDKELMRALDEIKSAVSAYAQPQPRGGSE